MAFTVVSKKTICGCVWCRIVKRRHPHYKSATYTYVGIVDLNGKLIEIESCNECVGMKHIRPVTKKKGV